jgi:hypothetical protein
MHLPAFLCIIIFVTIRKTIPPPPPPCDFGFLSLTHSILCSEGQDPPPPCRTWSLNTALCTACNRNAGRGGEVKGYSEESYAVTDTTTTWLAANTGRPRQSVGGRPIDILVWPLQQLVYSSSNVNMNNTFRSGGRHNYRLGLSVYSELLPHIFPRAVKFTVLGTSRPKMGIGPPNSVMGTPSFRARFWSFLLYRRNKM